MAKEHGKEINHQRGSATIEAVIAFTAFLFAIFTILGMVNFCRAQMLMSAAVDTAAKELSQYAYFYEMSGLQKFEKKLDANAEVGKNNINEVIGTVDALYSSINNAVDRTVQEKTDIANMIAAGEVDIGRLETAIAGLDNAGGDIVLGFQGVSAAMADIGNDPMLYMRSIVALIGSEGMEMAKRAIAAPLAKAFVSKHFGENTQAANAKLKALGIEGGLDSMNFNLSNVFSDEKHQDIEIVVIYKVKLLEVFDWVVLEANMSKVARCRAWLGGDAVITKAVATKQPSLNQGEQTPDPGKVPDDSGESENTQDGSSVDTEGSYWHMDEDNQGYNEIQAEFMDLTESTYGFEQEIADAYFMGRDEYGHAYGTAYCRDAEDAEGLNTEIFCDAIEHVASMEELYEETNGEKGYEPGSTTGYTCVIYVPENISEEEAQKILEKAKEDWQMYYEMAKEQYGIELQIDIEIVRAGGNYDYESEVDGDD